MLRYSMSEHEDTIRESFSSRRADATPRARVWGHAAPGNFLNFIAS